AELRDKAGVPYLMHEATRASCATRKVKDGETIGVGELKIAFLHTPGHTQDSLSLLVGEHLLSGDFLFIGSYGAGRLDLPGSDKPLTRISPTYMTSKLRQEPAWSLLLDVRTREEYTGELGHSSGTALIPVDVLASRLGEVPMGKVVAICRCGKRTSKAAALL